MTTAQAEQILEGLNERQDEAVKSITGETMVIAGAGSGKTSVLTRRVAYLISQGTPPGEILCLTFTNKAAKEMNNRVVELLNSVGVNIPRLQSWQIDYSVSPLLCTFHALGVRILREFGEKLGLETNFNILDSDDQKKTVNNILKELNIDKKVIAPKTALNFIGKCKRELLVPDESGKLTDEYPKQFHDIYRMYQARLDDSQCVDFEDLIFKSYLVIRDNDDVRQALQDRWKHIMIDEFQDTNEGQFKLVRLMYDPIES